MVHTPRIEQVGASEIAHTRVCALNNSLAFYGSEGQLIVPVNSKSAILYSVRSVYNL